MDKEKDGLNIAAILTNIREADTKQLLKEEQRQKEKGKSLLDESRLTVKEVLDNFTTSINLRIVGDSSTLSCSITDLYFRYPLVLQEEVNYIKVDFNSKVLIVYLYEGDV